ncbi:MAG: ATP synthase F1 subunit delta [Lachnospiraceae bacterium]|nr:ATP synthase F1 subunit delta [Lachnospiraceae bacterium]
MAKLVSKTYGDALFSVAVEENRVDAFAEEAKGLATVFSENQDLQKLMDNPKIIKEDKIKLIEETFTSHVSKEIIGLIALLISKGHSKDILSVFDYFIALVKEEKKIGTAFVTTAVELADAQKSAVEKRLLETTRYETFEMNYSVDESLIGGMVIRIGDRVVDSSIKTKLYELSKQLRSIQI